MWHDSVCNTVQEPTVTSTIVAEKTTTWGESGFPSEFLGRNTQGEVVATSAMASPCATMYAAFFAFQQVYARIRAVQRGLTDMGAPRELVSRATGAPLPTRVNMQPSPRSSARPSSAI